MLTVEQIEQFQKNGYLVFEALIQGERLAYYKQVFDELVERELVLHEFKSIGAQIPEHIVDSEIRRKIRADYNNNVGLFREELQSKGLSFKKYRELIHRQLIVQAMRSQQFSDTPPATPEEMRKEYAKIKPELRDTAKDKCDFEKIYIPKVDEDNLLATADSQLELTEDIVAKLKNGDDFAELARAYSDGPSGPRGGDLGFFGKGRMVKAFEEAAFALESGQTSDPIKTQFGWHIIKVEEKKGADDSLQVHARHILIEVRPGRDTLDSLRVAAEEFSEKAEDIGFDSTVNEAGLQSQDSGFITAGSFFPLLGNSTSGLVNNFLHASPGDISNIYENDQGIQVFSLREIREAGPRPVDEVKNQIVTRLKQKKKVRVAADRLTEVLGQIKTGKTLGEAAKFFNLDVKKPDAFATLYRHFYQQMQCELNLLSQLLAAFSSSHWI